MGQAPLCLLGVASFLLGSCSGYSSHSLHYFITSVSVPGQQTPQFFSVGYVDGQQFISYDAKARRCLPKVDWIAKVEKEAPQYWEEESQSFWNEEQRFQVNMVTAAKYYNQSGGVHTWQLMYGCELRRDGSKGGHYQFAYDGSDYIGLDKETLTWTAIDMPAQITKRKWEAEPAFAQRDKAYLEETCIKWLEKYLDYGKETLLRTACNRRTIIGSVIGVLLLIVLMTEFAVYFKVRQGGYRAAIVSDQGSKSSETA